MEDNNKKKTVITTLMAISLIVNVVLGIMLVNSQNEVERLDAKMAERYHEGYEYGYEAGYDDCTSEYEEEYSNEDNSEIVYITDTGSKYHRYGCRYLSDSCIEISLSDAISNGYTACSACY